MISCCVLSTLSRRMMILSLIFKKLVLAFSGPAIALMAERSHPADAQKTVPSFPIKAVAHPAECLVKIWPLHPPVQSKQGRMRHPKSFWPTWSCQKPNSVEIMDFGRPREFQWFLCFSAWSSLLKLFGRWDHEFSFKIRGHSQFRLQMIRYLP